MSTLEQLGAMVAKAEELAKKSERRDRMKRSLKSHGSSGRAVKYRPALAIIVIPTVVAPPKRTRIDRAGEPSRGRKPLPRSARLPRDYR